MFVDGKFYIEPVIILWSTYDLCWLLSTQSKGIVDLIFRNTAKCAETYGRLPIIVFLIRLCNDVTDEQRNIVLILYDTSS